MNHHLTQIAATLVLSTMLLASCSSGSSSGSTLTDAQILWCEGRWPTVRDTQETLGLKSAKRVWYENQGVTYSTSGVAQPSEALRSADEDWLPNNLDLPMSETGEFVGVVWAEWFEHPDGIRSCIAAYDSR